MEELGNDFKIFDSSNKNAFNEQSAQVSYLAASELETFCNQIIYLRSSLFILVLNGNASVEINFKDYQIEASQMAVLSLGHFLKIRYLSADFKCVSLYVGKEYIDEMYSSDMLYKRLKYDVRMHSSPILKLGNEETTLLIKRLIFLDKIVSNKAHRYYKEMILSSLLIYFLDLSNIIEEKTEKFGSEILSRNEILFQKFLDQLVNHYKTEHKADFYADALHISSHYLNTIVKKLSGQTVSDFVFQLLFREAKILLQQPNLSIQQIADELNFSDQSAFGKFFKRKEGISPKSFRKIGSL